MLNKLRHEFIDGKSDTEFVQRLEVFAKVLGEEVGRKSIRSP